MKKKIKRKQRIICPSCKTGMDSYAVDNSSPTCPYISCYNGVRCAYYVPVENTERKGPITKLILSIKNIFKR